MIRGVMAWFARRPATQIAGAMGVTAAVAIGASLLVTGAAVRADQRQQAALLALDDYGALVEKLGSDIDLSGDRLTEIDATFLSAWLSAFQSGPARDARSVEETCRTGRGGAGVRFLRASVGKPAGLAALETAPRRPLDRLGEGVRVVRLAKGVLCPARTVEAVVVERRVGGLTLIVGRVVDPPGSAWGWAVVAVLGLGVLLGGVGLAAAELARRRMASAVAEVSRTLDRAAVGDFSARAPSTAVAPELTVLTAHVNATLDRLEDLVRWMRDSADQMAHDFRTPLARAAVRLDRLSQASTDEARRALADDTREDLRRLDRSMNEALALRDGEAWTFEPVALDEIARQVFDLYEPVAEERGITLRCETAPVQVLGVRSLIQRSAANLTDNALKFSPGGGVVTLSTFADGAGGAFRVVDQGPGFSAPDADLGDQVARSRADGRQSHGLGLSFVRAVLRRHGGDLTIDLARPGAVVTAHFPR